MVAGSTEMGPMGPVREFVESFNTNDVRGMQAACTEATSIIDDFPPHEWSGRRATTMWYGEMASMASGEGMSEWSITLGEPRHLDVSDRAAYVVVPADVSWLQNGEPAGRACVMTMSVREGTGGWRISMLAWTWT